MVQIRLFPTVLIYNPSSKISEVKKDQETLKKNIILHQPDMPVDVKINKCTNRPTKKPPAEAVHQMSSKKNITFDTIID